MMTELQVKTCTKCNLEQPLTEFYKKPTNKSGINSNCKHCCRSATRIHSIKNITKIHERQKEYRENNKEKIRLRRVIYLEENKEHISEKRKEWKATNKEKVAERNKDINRFGGDKEKEKAYYKEKYQRNREKILARTVNYAKNNRKKITEREGMLRKQKKASDNVFAIKLRIGDLIRKSLKSKGYLKNSRTYQILGCTNEEFKDYIEKQFTDGMNWNNRSEWHIDHITPMALAKTEDDAIKLNHYENLRPLWAIDNLKKGRKIQ